MTKYMHGDPFFSQGDVKIPVWDVWRGEGPRYQEQSVVFAPTAQKRVMNVLASGYPEVSNHISPFGAYSVAQLQMYARASREEVINALHSAGDGIIKRTRSNAVESGTVEYALRARMPASLRTGWTLGFGSRGN